MTGEKLPQWQAARLATLLDALGGISVGARERASLTWLAGFEADTVANIAAVMRRLTRRTELLDRKLAAAIDDARSRHLEADRHRGQLIDLCHCEGIDPGEDPYAALLAHLRGREPGGEAVISVQVHDETCPDCGRGGPHTPVPGKPGTVECRVCSASWQQQPGGGRP